VIVKSAAGFLFDMDGTLIDSTQAMRRIWGRWARRHGLDFAALFPTVHGRRAIDTVRSLALPGVDPEVEAAIIDREETEDVEGVVAIAGAAEFLAALPPERWTIVTSAPKALARARLGAAGLPVPETILTAEEVTVGKPAPDCFILGAQRLGFVPADCVVFEDSEVGVESAIAAGADLVVIASAQSHASLDGRFAVSDYDELDVTVAGDRLHLKRRAFARQTTMAQS
jgi:sugar-phosphatase